MNTIDEKTFKQGLDEFIGCAPEGGWSDYWAMQQDWEFYKDSLCRDGVITQKQADSWSNPCTPETFARWQKRNGLVRRGYESKKSEGDEDKVVPDENDFEKCPYCGSHNTDIHYEVDLAKPADVLAYATCKDCGKEYHGQFVFTGAYYGKDEHDYDPIDTCPFCGSKEHTETVQFDGGGYVDQDFKCKSCGGTWYNSFVWSDTQSAFESHTHKAESKKSEGIGDRIKMGIDYNMFMRMCGSAAYLDDNEDYWDALWEYYSEMGEIEDACEFFDNLFQYTAWCDADTVYDEYLDDKFKDESKSKEECIQAAIDDGDLDAYKHDSGNYLVIS